MSATKGFDPERHVRMTELIARALPRRCRWPRCRGRPSRARSRSARPPPAVIASRDDALARRAAGAARLARVPALHQPRRRRRRGGWRAEERDRHRHRASPTVSALGENARAALVTRGLAEITRLAVALGGEPATLAGLAGLGDLVLTAPARSRATARSAWRWPAGGPGGAVAGEHPHGRRGRAARYARRWRSPRRHGVDLPDLRRGGRPCCSTARRRADGAARRCCGRAADARGRARWERPAVPELRKDPVVGRWVIISTERARRPSDFNAEPVRPAAAELRRSARATRTRRRPRSSPAARPAPPANWPGLVLPRGAEQVPRAAHRGRAGALRRRASSTG